MQKSKRMTMHAVYRRYLDLGANWRVVGNNGWYNYDFPFTTTSPRRSPSGSGFTGWIQQSTNQSVTKHARIWC
ncbi:hypothetical protein [Limosilactobacillus fermentum]